MFYHIVLIALLAALTYFWWGLIHSAPGMLQRLLPRGLVLGFGTVWFAVGTFSAFAAAYVLQEPDAMLHSFVSGYVGLWFVLATSVGMRGSYEDEQMLRRVLMMMVLMTGVIMASLHVRDPQEMAVLNLFLITGGFWLTTNYLHTRDRR